MEPKTSRKEHLDWCKARAMEYADQGDFAQAFTSMASDLRKHPETESHLGIQLGFAMLMSDQLNSYEATRHFIEGFN